MQGAVESLPEFSVTNEPAENRQRIAAGAENLVAPLVAPTSDFSSVSQSTAVTYAAFSSAMSESPEMQKTPQNSMISQSCPQYARRESNPQPSDPKFGSEHLAEKPKSLYQTMVFKMRMSLQADAIHRKNTQYLTV